MPNSDLTVKLIARFKEIIAEGALAPGSKLPAERELAPQFGVSRPSLRQALKVLEIMGVVSQRVGDGTYLTGNASQILSEPMEFLILLDGISIYELLEARSIMEPELTALAAERATAEDLRLLAKAIEKHEKNRHNLTTAIDADLSFHQAIVQAAGNRACSRMLTFIHRSVWKTLAVTSQLAKLQDLLASHKAIYAAIYRRDADEARRQMAKHLGATRELLMKASTLPVNLRLAQTILPVKAPRTTGTRHTAAAGRKPPIILASTVRE